MKSVISVVPYSAANHLAELREGAALDGDSVFNATHTILKYGKIVGHIELESVPVTSVWFSSRDMHVFDSLEAHKFIVENAKSKLIFGCSKISPLYNYLVKLGYKDLNVSLFTKDGTI